MPVRGLISKVTRGHVHHTAFTGRELLGTAHPQAWRKLALPFEVGDTAGCGPLRNYRSVAGAQSRLASRGHRGNR